MNSTETPGGSGIPAGWYDNPSGEGLRWWDGERWTEHVHAGAAEAATETTAARGTRREETTAARGARREEATTREETTAREATTEWHEAPPVDDGEAEGAPPRDLVKLRESIRARGVKAVGMVVGAAVLVIVVVALLLSGGSGGNGDRIERGAAAPQAGKADTGHVAQARLRKIDRRLRSGNLSKAQRKKLKAEKRRLEKAAGSGRGAR